VNFCPEILQGGRGFEKKTERMKTSEGVGSKGNSATEPRITGGGNEQTGQVTVKARNSKQRSGERTGRGS